MRGMCIVGFGAVFFLSHVVPSQDCVLGPSAKVSDDFLYSLSTAQGAVGDVVAVDVELTVHELRPDLRGLILVGCYDERMAELVGEPIPSGIMDQMFAMYEFFPIGGPVGPQRPNEGHGIALSANFYPGAAEKFLSPHMPLQLLTLYFRLKGNPGDTFQVDLCDDFRFRGGGCLANSLVYIPETGGSHSSISTLHQAGEVRVIAGEPTRPEPPSVPPEAKIYEEAPSVTDVAALFELNATVTQPDTADVPLDLYITSAYEFSNFTTAIHFPSRYVEVSRVVEHTRPGVINVRNDLGLLGIALAKGSRRVGRQGERVHVATVFVNVSKAASEVSEIPLVFTDLPLETNWVGVRSAAGLTSVQITTQVTPLFVAGAIVKIQKQALASGDANVSYGVDVTDAIVILNDLFLGTKQILCHEAADFDANGAIDLADAVALLDYLFRGHSMLLSEEIICNRG